MRSTTTLVVLTVGALLATNRSPAHAQVSQVHAQIGFLADVFEGTPGLQGLLPTAVSEAAIAAQHVELANAAGASLYDVQLHASHVLHALDPTLASGGPGLGYGARLATATAASYIASLASDSTASDNVRTHAVHIRTILATVLARMDRAVSLVQEIQATSNAPVAASLLGQLTAHVEGMTMGTDIDRDGRIGWQSGEGGLRQATQHLTLLRRGEGLIP